MSQESKSQKEGRDRKERQKERKEEKTPLVCVCVVAGHRPVINHGLLLLLFYLLLLSSPAFLSGRRQITNSLMDALLGR